MPTNNNNVILITSCGKGTKRERKNKKETLKVRKRERKEENRQREKENCLGQSITKKHKCTIANTKTNEFFCYFEQKIQIVFFVTNPFYV
jgi:hypothetical protein